SFSSGWLAPDKKRPPGAGVSEVGRFHCGFDLGRRSVSRPDLIAQVHALHTGVKVPVSLAQSLFDLTEGALLAARVLQNSSALAVHLVERHIPQLRSDRIAAIVRDITARGLV